MRVEVASVGTKIVLDTVALELQLSSGCNIAAISKAHQHFIVPPIFSFGFKHFVKSHFHCRTIKIIRHDWKILTGGKWARWLLFLGLDHQVPEFWENLCFEVLEVDKKESHLIDISAMVNKKKNEYVSYSLDNFFFFLPLNVLFKDLTPNEDGSQVHSVVTLSGIWYIGLVQQFTCLKPSVALVRIDLESISPIFYFVYRCVKLMSDWI